MLSKTLSMVREWNIQESSVQIETGPATTVCTWRGSAHVELPPFGRIKGGDTDSRPCCTKNELKPGIVL